MSKRRRIDAKAMPHGDLTTDLHGPSVRVRVAGVVIGLSRNDALTLGQRLREAEKAFSADLVTGGGRPMPYEGRYPIRGLRTLADLDGGEA